MDWVDDELSPKDLFPYSMPMTSDYPNSVRVVFLGYYFKWDPKVTYEMAKRYGFKEAASPKTGLYNFADIDDEFLITVHHWMKWYKFGFTRLWDNLSIEIRAGRLTREDAIEHIRTVGNEYPREEIEKFCDYLNITNEHFNQVVDSFRSTEIWENSDGIWKIPHFLIHDWKWI